MIKKPYIHKRIIAYVVDILIISMLASLVTMVFPKNDDYNTSLNELTSITKKYQNEEITTEEYYALYDDVNYDLTKNSVEMTIVIIAISLLYFVVYNYYNNGVTIGKRLMKIKIVSANDKELTINKYLFRTLIINSSLANIISTILLLSLSKNNYILYNNKLSTIFTVIYVLCFVFSVYRNDGRGLHDLIAGTKVIDIKNNDNKDLVKEAEVIEKQEVVENKEELNNNVKEDKNNNKDNISKKVNKKTSNNKNVSNKKNINNKSNKNNKGSDK